MRTAVVRSARVIPEAGGQPTRAGSLPSGTRAQVIEIIRSVFGSHADKAIAVARCETHGSFDPLATGKAGERGPFQIHPVHRGFVAQLGYTWDDMYNPTINARVAFALSRGGTDWHAWTCRRAA